jgi:hypothetical protein
MRRPPGHLILGSDALRLVAETRAAFDAERTAWQSGSPKHVSVPYDENT